MVTTLFALVSRMMAVLDTEERKKFMLFLVGKRSEACGNQGFPQNNTFVRMAIMAKVY